MNPDTPLYGRITTGQTRTSLGRAAISTLMIRAMEQIRKTRHAETLVIQIELSPSKLQDSSTFDRHSILAAEQAQLAVDSSSGESPFPGISLARVAEAIASPEYAAYEKICDPEQRIGLNEATIKSITESYSSAFPDCFSSFPRWVLR